MVLQSYRDLDVWKRAIDLVESIYKLTANFPSDEKFGLTSQVRRAAISISSNIAEGYGRKHRGDYLRHLSFAAGSLAEVETQLIISVRLQFVSKEQLRESWEVSQEVARMLSKLISSLQE